MSNPSGPEVTEDAQAGAPETSSQGSTEAPSEAPQVVKPERSYEEVVESLKATSAEAKSYRQKNADLNKQIEQIKTDADKALESVSKERDDLRSEIFNLKKTVIAKQYALSDEDAETFLVGDDIEHIEKVAKALYERSAPARKVGLFVPDEGRSAGAPHSTSHKSLAKSVFGG